MFMSADKSEFHTNNSLKYVPGKSRSHHLEMMMSKDELEEEQRSVQNVLLLVWWPHFTRSFALLSRCAMRARLI